MLSQFGLRASIQESIMSKHHHMARRAKHIYMHRKRQADRQALERAVRQRDYSDLTPSRKHTGDREPWI
jgi:hypothetical protein